MYRRACIFLSTTSSMDMQDVYISPTRSVDVQGEPLSTTRIIDMQVGCPRKWVFDFRRNTEFLEKHTEFREIPRNSAVFLAVKLNGIPRNSAEFRMYLHTEFRR